MKKNYYGQELILDLHGCNTELFSRKDIKIFFDEVIDIAGVEAGDLYFWDYHGFGEIFTGKYLIGRN